MKKIILFSALVTVFAFSACTDGTNSSDNIDSYPSKYIEANLPQYPNAAMPPPSPVATQTPKPPFSSPPGT